MTFWEGRLGSSSTRPGDLLERWGKTICMHRHIYICIGLRVKGLGWRVKEVCMGTIRGLYSPIQSLLP